MSVQSKLTFQMSPAEKMAQQLYVDKLNKENFSGQRIPKQELGKNDFLQLLIAQLSHQDPTAPMEDTQFIAQMAQFTSLEQLTNMSSGIEKLGGLFSDTNAVNAVGKRVDIEADSKTASGYITAATRGENPEVQVNGTWYEWSAVKTVYSE